MSLKKMNHNAKYIFLPRWAISVIVIKTIICSSQFGLPVGLGIFTCLFNVAQGMLFEGIIVGLVACFIMLFLMQIATIRRLTENNELNRFIQRQRHQSRFSGWLIKAVISHQ